MAFEELLPYLTAAVAVVAVLLIFYATRFRKTKVGDPVLPSPVQAEAAQKWRSRAQRSISSDDASGAKNELRTLSLEREILSDAIRRLYEAHAEGKITEDEREQLGKRYKSRMMTIREAISENESLVALHELETMQEDLIKLFDERFDELNVKIETLRSQVGVEAEETILPSVMSLSQMEKEVPEKTRVKRKKKASRKPSQKSRKTEAEERIEKIQAEVEKVLDRLEQMEAEP